VDDIGAKIKAERLSRNLKQCDFAKKIGISNTYLSDIELGRTTPSIKTLSKISKALDLDIKNFL